MLNHVLSNQLLSATLAMFLASAPLVEGASVTDRLEAMPFGNAIKLSLLGWPDAKTICVLQPYQERLATRGNFAEDLNARLEAEEYKADEGYFTFVVAREHRLDLTRVNRSARLDILGSRQHPNQELLPNGFVQAECASGETAMIAKVMLRERVYIAFGEMKGSPPEKNE